jgi:multidrug efflux pump subunit AcrA (membrane-fusion protein)
MMDQNHESEGSKRHFRWSQMFGWLGAVLFVGLVSAGIVLAYEMTLRRQQGVLQQALAQGPRVSVVPLNPGPASRSLEIPGTIRGYVETSVYAKTAGYMKTINVDKGDQVKEGQVIAVLESPELDKQVADAKAWLWLEKVTDDREQYLLRAYVASRQEADVSHAAYLQAQAAYEQLLALQSYEIVKAPFDGIVTARFVDPGVLIPQATTPSTANTPTSSTTVATTNAPIIAMATLEPLRVFANVPQSASPTLNDGDPAVVTVSEYPGREFAGVVTRHPDALDPATRTMLIEIDLPNKDHALYPGMYSNIQITSAAAARTLVAPDDALVFRNNQTYLPVVRNNHLQLAQVTLGLDDGHNVEVTGPVHQGDLVAMNLGQAPRDGTPVQPIANTSTN